MQALPNDNSKIKDKESKWRKPPPADDFINFASFDFPQSLPRSTLLRAGSELVEGTCFEVSYFIFLSIEKALHSDINDVRIKWGSVFTIDPCKDCVPGFVASKAYLKKSRNKVLSLTRHYLLAEL